MILNQKKQRTSEAYHVLLSSPILIYFIYINKY